ncbi:MAG TPA: PAS domain-containing protein [Solirubrobacteraceae bacterium]|nr:PAS domain-containing protein [Solirubrobacteraceae bacterium]
MLGGRRGGGSHDRINALVAFLAGAAAAGVTSRHATRADGAPVDDGATPTRDQLHAMLANLSEAVTVTDRDRRMRYANHAAAELLGCATPEELLALPLAAIAAHWESTHEDGRRMVAEDVPSYKIVNGQRAEPLLTRIVNRETGEQRWRLVKAAPLRGPAGELLAISVSASPAPAIRRWSCRDLDTRRRPSGRPGCCSA